MKKLQNNCISKYLFVINMQTVVPHRSYTTMNAKVPIPTTETISSFMSVE